LTIFNVPFACGILFQGGTILAGCVAKRLEKAKEKMWNWFS
jgi:hypothetical protein